MSYPVFYVPAGDVLPVLFASYAGSTGASATLTGLAVTDIEIYKDGSVTQRASDAGYTLLDTDGIDFDSITGIHGFSIDTGDNTDAGFYTVGAWFTVVVSTVTIDSQTVSFIACQFRLMPAEGIAGKPKVDVDAWLGTAAATPSVAGVPEVDLTHVAGATTNVAALATNVDAILTDTGTTLQGELDGIQADTEDIQSRLPASLTADGNMKADTLRIGGTLQTANDVGADVDAILVDTAEIGVAGAGLTNINLPNQTMDIVGNITGNLSGSVGSVTGAVGSVTGNVGGNVTGSVGSLATQAKADVNAEVDTAISDAALATAANLATVAGYLDTEIAAILVDTNELQTDWANGGRLDTILDARASQTSVDDLPTNSELTTALAAADDAVLAAIAALNNLSQAQAQTAAAAALTAYDPPTNAEMEARTLTAALIAKLTSHLNGVLTGVVGSGSTTTSLVLNSSTGINGTTPSSTNDFYNGRVVVFLTGTLAGQATDISDYVGSTVTMTITAVTSAPSAGDTFILV